jgi:hypothetical protein
VRNAPLSDTGVIVLPTTLRRVVPFRDYPLRQGGGVRDFLDSRAFVLRNAKRPNTTLGLMRLHLSSTYDERAYLALLRQVLEDEKTQAPKQRTNADPKGLTPSLRR